MNFGRTILCFLITLVFVSCNNKQSESDEPKVINATISEVKEVNNTPTVDIDKYYLVSDGENRKNDANEILKIKRKWPQIMQSPTTAGFDSLLTKDFTFVDNGTILNRAEYIKNRTLPSEWKITFVKYDNLSLQFFGDIATLTYRNHVRNENSNDGTVEIEHISWMDVYSKEDNKWKIRSAHVIDISIEELK